jgi:hypothetical protein
MSEKKTPPLNLQSYFGCINAKTEEGAVLIQFLQKKEPYFLKFAARKRKERQAEGFLNQFMTSMNEAGFESVDDFLVKHPNKKWLARMMPSEGRTKKKKKASKKPSPPHPILSYTPEQMKVYVDKVREEITKTGLAPLRAANQVALRDYKIEEPLKYLALKNAILHRYAPDLIPANQSPTPSPKF